MMALVLSSVEALLPEWDRQRAQYDPSAYAMILCGGSTALDHTCSERLVLDAAVLDDVSGPYVALTVVGWAEPDAPSVPDRIKQERAGGDAISPSMSYFHRAYARDFDGRSVYDLAHALGLPLEDLPLVLMCFTPWLCDEFLVYDFRTVLAVDGAHTEDDGDSIMRFLLALLSAARNASGERLRKRARRVDREMSKKYSHDFNMGERAIRSGLIAQIVEGLAKGMPG